MIVDHDTTSTMGQVTLAEGLADLTTAIVFEQYRDRIYCYILRLVRDPAEAEDLTQETFLRAHRKLESLQDRAALTAWLYRIATHLCYDRFRQSSYHHPLQSLDTVPDDPSGQAEAEDAPRLDQVIEQAEMSACVQEFLKQVRQNRLGAPVPLAARRHRGDAPPAPGGEGEIESGGNARPCPQGHWRGGGQGGQKAG